MPSKNIRKDYVTQSFYHIYNRGVEKRKIFLDDQDFAVFLSYLKRHLGKEAVTHKSTGYVYPNFNDSLSLLAFCLMPNHFHMLVYQHDKNKEITKFMRSVCTAYTVYFNKKYKRVGHLFQERYKGILVSSDMYVQHISRYIHLNPKDFQNYKWSSLHYYTKELHADWVKPAQILAMFDNTEEYINFVSDYMGQHEIMDDLKHELAAL